MKTRSKSFESGFWSGFFGLFSLFDTPKFSRIERIGGDFASDWLALRGDSERALKRLEKVLIAEREFEMERKKR